VTDHPRPAGRAGCAGCGGFLGLLATVLLVVLVVGVFLVDEQEPPQERVPVPEDVPPARAVSVHDLPATAESLAIPENHLEGYVSGARTVSTEFPSCNIAWNTLAGIGFIESHHGNYGADGDSGLIIGPQLDGTGSFMEIPDTDNGELDGDTEYDRAVGPMQFLPESWGIYGAGGDPHDIGDAAAAAGRLLCGDDRDLDTAEGWSAALFSYNRSEEYMVSVRDAAANYALGQPA
jgi:membrane-bound lytic murein transglycosylase B